jgi:undecaprenyl-diphosphatase
LAVIFFFWKKLWGNWELWLKSIVGVLPAIVLGALFASKIQELFFNTWTVAIALFIGGIIILWVENQKRTPKINSIKELTYKTVLIIGLIQCLAMIPGTSRSAATIIGAMLLGANRIVATEFSFFLAIPTLFAASAWSTIEHWNAVSMANIPILLVGFIVSFVVAWLVIKFLMSYIQKHNFKIFGWYRVVLALIILIFFL